MTKNDDTLRPRSLDRSIPGICFRRFYWWCHVCPVRTGLTLMLLFVSVLMLWPRKPVTTMRVRLTAYWSLGADTDRWSARGISSTGVPLREKKSVAVDPKVIPYGSRVIWPEGKAIWMAVDTGSAVRNRTASRAWGEDVPVVDVFFLNRQDALDWAGKIPNFVTVEIYPPEDGWRGDPVPEPQDG